ncbi:hypothetical protein GCM10010191_00120 [Actinomadura vinacea]|uniref:EamA family transporter n=1 Tax=Actinomadura vinacea TaxID=115336 RepID=A0ABN3I8B4_9ACTN
METNKQDERAVPDTPGDDADTEPKIAPMLVLASLSLGQLSNVILLATGVLIEQGSVTTVFLQTAFTTILLWFLVRPKRKAGWSLWWRGLLLGSSNAASLVAFREAQSIAPYATVTCTWLVLGPMMAAGYRIVRSQMWRALGWLALTLPGTVLVVDGLKPASITALLWVGVTAVTYHIHVKINSGLPKEDIDTCSTLGKMTNMVVVTVLLLSVEGSGALLGIDWKALAVCSGAAVLFVGSTLLMNAAWKTGLHVTSHAMLMPAKPALSLLLGMIAGQFLSLANWLGIALVTVAGWGSKRTQIRDQTKKGRRPGLG